MAFTYKCYEFGLKKGVGIMWRKERFLQFKEMLIENSDEKYKAFHSKLVPGIENLLGVRGPVMKKIAAQIAKNDWRDFADTPDHGIYEERMIKGLSIAMAKTDIDEKLKIFDKFIPLIDNWAVCDMVCAAFKLKKGEEDILFKFASEKALSDDEFTSRVGIVLLMGNFINTQYIDSVLDIFSNVKEGKYYVNMALAWAISVCLVKFEDKTVEFLNKNILSDFTHNKALQKARESSRISDEKKKLYQSMKRQSVAK